MINCLILTEYVLIHQSVLALERQLKGELLKLDQSGFKVCTHTCTQWCRGATWLVMLFSAFTETATSEAAQGAAILDLSSGVTWRLLLLCECHQSDPVSKRCVILPHRDTLFYGGGLWNGHSAKRYNHIIWLLGRGKRLNKCWYLLQIQSTNERKVRAEVR